MTEKNIMLKTRIQNKYKSLEEWNNIVAGEFIPLKGEICYAVENGMLFQKIGDGVTDFVDLPWILNQADYAENDSNSPAYIKNRLAYEISQAIEREYIEGKLYVEMTTDVPENDAGTTNMTIAMLDSGCVPNFTQEQWEDINTKFVLQITDANNVTEFKADLRKKATQQLDGTNTYCIGNTQAANMFTELMEVGKLFEDDVITHSLNYAFVIMGYVDPDDKNFYFSTVIALLDTDVYTAIPNYCGDYDGYNIKLAISEKLTIKQIDDKFIDQAQADYSELDYKAKSYVRNRPGTIATANLAQFLPDVGSYKGKLTFNGLSIAGGYGIRSETVENALEAGVLSMTSHCIVKINGEIFTECPVFQRNNILYAGGTREPGANYIIGNPKLVSDIERYYIDYLFTGAGINLEAYIADEEDNGLPFAFGIVDTITDRPISDGTIAIFDKFANSTGSINIEILPQRIKLGTRPLDKYLLPPDKVLGTLDEDLGAITLGEAYEASGANSLAANYGTIASGAYSTALNQRTKAEYQNQLVIGSFNLSEDKSFIIGNGSSEDDRKNIYTVDRDGSIWSNGNISAEGNFNIKGQASMSKGIKVPDIILTSPNGSQFKITVDNDGTLLSTEL